MTYTTSVLLVTAELMLWLEYEDFGNIYCKYYGYLYKPSEDEKQLTTIGKMKLIINIFIIYYSKLITITQIKITKMKTAALPTIPNQMTYHK